MDGCLGTVVAHTVYFVCICTVLCCYYTVTFTRDQFLTIRAVFELTVVLRRVHHNEELSGQKTVDGFCI